MNRTYSGSGQRRKQMKKGLLIYGLALLLISLVLIGANALAEGKKGIIPSELFKIKPFIIISHFPTGTNRLISDRHYEPMTKILKTLRETAYICVLVGTVSDLSINCPCYHTADYSQFSLRPFDGAIEINPADKKIRSDMCQNALALSRAVVVRNWLIEGLKMGETPVENQTAPR